MLHFNRNGDNIFSHQHPIKTFRRNFVQSVCFQSISIACGWHIVGQALGVYGPALKEVIQEEFGDGIMSAIDFTVNVERERDPAGDRVKLTWSGKFLPYKKF